MVKIIVAALKILTHYDENQDHQIFETELIPRKQAKMRFRDSILISWGYCCAYCGEMLNEHNTTLDHVIPRHAGGQTTRSNLIAACFGCNSNKSGKPWREWFRTRYYWTECRERYIEEWLEQ